MSVRAPECLKFGLFNAATGEQLAEAKPLVDGEFPPDGRMAQSVSASEIEPSAPSGTLVKKQLAIDPPLPPFIPPPPEITPERE